MNAIVKIMPEPVAESLSVRMFRTLTMSEVMDIKTILLTPKYGCQVSDVYLVFENYNCVRVSILLHDETSIVRYWEVTRKYNQLTVNRGAYTYTTLADVCLNEFCTVKEIREITAAALYSTSS